MLSKEDIKAIIKNLEEYSAECIGKKEEKPIVVVGPAGEQWTLRVYCYGGDIGALGMNEVSAAFNIEFNGEDQAWSKVKKRKSRIIGEGYERYLRKKFVDLQKHIYELPLEMRERYKDCLDKSEEEREEEERYKADPDKKYPKYIPGLDKDFVGLLNEGKGEILWKNILEMNDQGRKYLDYAIAATYSRFENSKDAGEKKVQTKLVKKYRGAAKETKYIIVDREFRVDGHQPDIIVFDGKSFGLVEIKYAGKNMKRGDSNSLDKHFEKFYQSIYEGNSFGIVKECYRRLRILQEYDLIDRSWDEDITEMQKMIETAGKLEEIKQNETARALLWMGFLFVEGDGKDSDDSETAVNKKMKEQLGKYFPSEEDPDNAYYQTADVRYQYTTNQELELNMDKDKKYIRKEIMDREYR
ncbi:MAG: hypothetical protein K6F35_11905 [Lachnospiraceae bacterium]|nr:hypothetical protein [Lachnospiraceae bacterium]